MALAQSDQLCPDGTALGCLVGVGRERLVGVEKEITFDRQTELAANGLYLRERYRAEFCITKAQIAKPELCGATIYVEMAHSTPDSQGFAGVALHIIVILSSCRNGEGISHEQGQYRHHRRAAFRPRERASAAHHRLSRSSKGAGLFTAYGKALSRQRHPFRRLASMRGRGPQGC